MVHRSSTGAALSPLVLTLLISLAPSPFWGQTLKGTILGTLTDASHAVVPGAQVAITDVNTNFRRSDTSNNSGFFVGLGLGANFTNGTLHQIGYDQGLHVEDHRPHRQLLGPGQRAAKLRELLVTCWHRVPAPRRAAAGAATMPGAAGGTS